MNGHHNPIYTTLNSYVKPFVDAFFDEKLPHTDKQLKDRYDRALNLCIPARSWKSDIESKEHHFHEAANEFAILAASPASPQLMHQIRVAVPALLLLTSNDIRVLLQVLLLKQILLTAHNNHYQFDARQITKLEAIRTELMQATDSMLPTASELFILLQAKNNVLTTTIMLPINLGLIDAGTKMLISLARLLNSYGYDDPQDADSALKFQKKIIYTTAATVGVGLGIFSIFNTCSYKKRITPAIHNALNIFFQGLYTHSNLAQLIQQAKGVHLAANQGQGQQFRFLSPIARKLDEVQKRKAKRKKRKRKSFFCSFISPVGCSLD